MSYGTGPGQPPYGNEGWGAQPPVGGYGYPQQGAGGYSGSGGYPNSGGFPPQAPGGYPVPVGGGYGPPQPPPTPSQGVTVASVIAAVVNGLGMLASFLLFWPAGFAGLIGMVLGIVGAATNGGNPKGAKIMMILSWVVFGLTALAWIALIIIGIAFIASYESGY